MALLCSNITKKGSISFILNTKYPDKPDLDPKPCFIAPFCKDHSEDKSGQSYIRQYNGREQDISI